MRSTLPPFQAKVLMVRGPDDSWVSALWEVLLLGVSWQGA